MPAATTMADVAHWLVAPRENEHLEFKEATLTYATDKLYRYCVALANEGGGKLVLGISDKPPRRVVGSGAFTDPADVASKIFQKLRFRVDVEEVSHTDGRLVVFHIPPRPTGTAYSVEGAYLMRSTEDTVAMSEDRLRQIFNEGKPDWSASPACDGIDGAEVVRLLDTQSYFDLLNVPYPKDRDGVLSRFKKENLIRTSSGGRWRITNLGAILFAKKLDEFGVDFARKAPRVVVYDDRNKLQTRSDQTGAKGYAVGFKGLIEVVSGLIPSNEVIEQALRKQVKMFPEIAIRELIANSLIHQDFGETGASVMVEIYSDRIEISNPGRPFISPDRFIDEYQSRNERVADIMRRLGMCEEKGSGVDKVVASAEAFQLPAPDFRVSERRTTAILFAHRKFEEMDAGDRVRACYQHCCLRYVTNQHMTNQSLRGRFSLSEAKSETVSRIIRDAVDDRRIKLADPSSTSKRYTKYVPFWA